MSSITGNSENIFINGANLKIAGTGKSIIFADGSVMNSAPPNADTLNTAYFSNAINAFVITETTAKTGFAGNTNPQHAISVGSNLFMSNLGDITTLGAVSIGTTSSNANLHVAGNIYASVSSNEYGTFHVHEGSGGTKAKIVGGKAVGSITLSNEPLNDGTTNLAYNSVVFQVDNQGGVADWGYIQMETNGTWASSNQIERSVMAFGVGNNGLTSSNVNDIIQFRTPTAASSIGNESNTMIMKNGYVGVGPFDGVTADTSPQANLHVIGNVFATNDIETLSSTSGYYGVRLASSNGESRIYCYDATSSNAGLDGNPYIRMLPGTIDLQGFNADTTNVHVSEGDLLIKDNLRIRESNTNAIAIGENAGETDQFVRAIAIGINAGKTSQGEACVALGRDAGMSGQNNFSIAIGTNAGETAQGVSSAPGGSTGAAVAIGFNAAFTGQEYSGLAIGLEAGRTNQNEAAVAVGRFAGWSNQQTHGIAIGRIAGQFTQGSNSIAIGYQAGRTSQASDSIVLNSSGSVLNTTNSGFYVSTLRADNGSGLPGLVWDSSSKEISTDTSVTSDDRLKHNEEEVSNVLSSIDQLKLLKYDKTNVMLDADFMGDLGDIPHYRDAGFIAQDVLQIPEFAWLVRGGGQRQVITTPGEFDDETGEEITPPEYGTEEVPYNLNYKCLANYSIQAIQELHALVKTLQARIEVLENGGA